MSQILGEKLASMSESGQKLWALRHTAEHILHAAMQNLYPKLKKAMGPATEEGFYFDFDLEDKITEKDFPEIEKEMKRIIEADLPMVKEEISAERAKELFKDNPYKLEWIEDIALRQAQGYREKISLYKMGDEDVDLCSGPHAKSTGKIKAFKLLSVAGAYWHGDEKNKMLTRIYGTAFSTKDELDKFIWQKEEAQMRDHKKMGRELDLFTFSELVGSGLPLYTPKGALIRRLLNKYVEETQSKEGYTQVWTPQIAKAELFKISGHYDKYRENMFKVLSNYSDEEFFLKPMNCPQHIQIYAARGRSYKDLPLRFTDFAMLYRDEKPGEINGLARTRAFSQDDCHVFCREDQVEEEVDKALGMTKKIMTTFGFKYRYRMSTRDKEHPEKYLGDPKVWNKVEHWAEDIMQRNKIDHFPGPGEAAFYAPKMDLLATDSLGREWQLSTIQIDFFMPERFDLVYTDKDGKKARPVMIHRAIIGSPERFIMILLEHFAGNLPVWLAPVQAKILPITERSTNFGLKILKSLKENDIRAEIDERNETLQAKIRDAQLEKVPYMLIVGDKEEKGGTVSVRERGGKDLGVQKLEGFIKTIKNKVEAKSLD